MNSRMFISRIPHIPGLTGQDHPSKRPHEARRLGIVPGEGRAVSLRPDLQLFEVGKERLLQGFGSPPGSARASRGYWRGLGSTLFLLLLPTNLPLDCAAPRLGTLGIFGCKTQVSHQLQYRW